MLIRRFRLVVGWATAAVQGWIAIDQLKERLATIRHAAMQDAEVAGLAEAGAGGPVPAGGEYG